MQSPKAAPRVAFGSLVENGMLVPGRDADRRQAPLEGDGAAPTARSNRRAATVGSIHKLGATLQNAPACNGWTFWHYEAADGLKPIDALRQNYLLATQP